MPPETLMGHIHLHVADLTKTEEFYTKALGFDVVSRYGGMALFISTGRYHHHIGLNTWSGVGAPAPSENSVGLKSYTLLFPDEAVRGKVVEQLGRMGAWVKEEKDVVLTKDTSGNLIELAIETKN
ncbi:MAG TPA: VOC family protein [Chondromyces sp.]|nr:VOC family protein [Chondromyces sp.]